MLDLMVEPGQDLQCSK